MAALASGVCRGGWSASHSYMATGLGEAENELVCLKRVFGV